MKPLLGMAHVTKRFGALKVLDDLTFRVETGEAVGLIGANGAGKTTLLRIAAGLMTADAGLVCRPAANRALRYFGGERTLPPEVRLDRWSALFGMRCRDRRRMGQLSRGNRQLFGLRVTLGGPLAGLVLLDEPWEGLDPSGSAWLTGALAEWQAAGAGLLISSHRLHDLDAACSRFLLLRGGRCQEVSADQGPAVLADLVAVRAGRTK